MSVSSAGATTARNGTIAEGSRAAAVITATPAYSSGAAAGSFTIDLGSMTQYAGGSVINSRSQDGQGAGYATEYEFDKQGNFYAVFQGGARELVGTLQLATFNNAEGLDRVGNSLYRNNGTAGTATLLAPGAEGAGKLSPSSLERSGVDVATEFVELVVFQRGYQANSQMLNATNGMLRDTIGLLR